MSNVLSVDDLQRFWSKIEPDPATKCWNWGGSFQADKGNGTGITPKLIINKQEVNARRLSWQLAFGTDVPPRVSVKCDNQRCIHPAHLVPAPPGNSKTKHNCTPRPRAECSFTEPKLVRRVMTLRRKGWTLARIGEELGVCPSRVSFIATMAELCQQGKLKPRKRPQAVD